MEMIFIDPEPPDAAGGGIRTYIRLAMRICRESGWSARVYTHSPAAYPGEDARPIGRKPWLRRPFRGLAYRFMYQENVLWEHSNWLNAEFASGDAPDRVYEFCDFLGYGFFAVRNRALRDRVILRVHTPAFLVSPPPGGRSPAALAARLGAWRERDTLSRARRITAPSAAFIAEKLPWLSGWEHIPNPLPMETPGESAPESALAQAEPAGADTVDTAAIAESAPAPPEAPGSGWIAAAPDAAELAERNAPRPTRIEPDRFLYLGRVEERKGVLILLRAFIRLAGEKPFASLTLVGGAGPGSYAASVRYLIESQPPPIRLRIHWKPPCTPEERAGLFKEYSVLVAPSLWENSPYVYFEGMAAGLPCIGTATGEMKAVAATTGAPSPEPGDEGGLLAAMRACCGRDGRAVIPAQWAYLRERRSSIPERLRAAWRATAAPP